jgi:hypothetical protein
MCLNWLVSCCSWWPWCGHTTDLCCICQYILFALGKGGTLVWLGMWGANPERLRHVGIQPLQPAAGGKRRNYFSQGPPLPAEGDMGHVVSFNYTSACMLQLKTFTANLSPDSWKVLDTVYSHSIHVKVSLTITFVIYQTVKQLHVSILHPDHHHTCKR